MGWTVEFLDSHVLDEMSAMPGDIRARFERIIHLIEEHGLPYVHEPYVKHIEGPIWEMRAKGKDGIARALYVTITGKRVVIVRIFVKKTQRTPKREIEIARNRSKGLL
jgi:phage-related protein